MADTPDKLVTAESIKALHDYNKKTYSDVGHTHNTLVFTHSSDYSYADDNVTLNVNGFKSTCNIGSNANDLDYELVIKNQIDGMKMSYKNDKTDSSVAHITTVKGECIAAQTTEKNYGSIVDLGYGSELSLYADSSGVSTSIILRDYSSEVLKKAKNLGVSLRTQDYCPSINFKIGEDIHSSFVLNENKEFDLVDQRGASFIRPYTNNGNLAIGYGGYEFDGGTDGGTKATNIYGKTIKIWSNAAGLVGSEYGVNKLLWSGANRMGKNNNAIQAITLNDKISAQPHGIVLMWSWYDTDKGDAKDWNWHYHFVPKRHLKYHAGEGVNFQFALALYGTVGGKYLYIRDTEIVGAESNTQSGTGASGIKYNNKKFILRGIIGV